MTRRLFNAALRAGMFALLVVPVRAEEADMRVWRAIGGYKTTAAFVKYDAGVVTLRKEDGETVEVRLERLHPSDRTDVVRMAGDHAHGSIPRGRITKPEGRRELTWEEILRGTPWPEGMHPNEKEALESLRRGWKHAETKYFIVHYQQVGYAKRVARMADFFYEYIAADLPGFRDRSPEKSHIVVVRKSESWREFLEEARTAPAWAGAFVRGNVMFLYDMDDNEAGADLLAHEMSHLVLNRFFRRPPPLWLNEGLAEWYGNFGWKAFKGQHVNPEDGMRELGVHYTLKELMSLRAYPGDPMGVRRFYATSKQVVGMLKLRKDQRNFVKFLQAITVDGEAPLEPLREVYGIDGVGEFQRAFNEFLD